MLRLPKIITSRASSLVENLLNLVKYDPNYTYSNEEQGNDVAEYQDYYDDYYDYNVCNNDDSSWKVRRGSVKVIFSIVKSRMEIDKGMTSRILEELTICLQEHDENTKIEIINCISVYLRSFIIVDENVNLTKKVSYVNLITSIIDNLILKVEKELGGVVNTGIKLALIKMLTSISDIDQFKLISCIQVLNKCLNSFYKESNDSALLITGLFSKIVSATYCSLDIHDIISIIYE